MQDWNSASHPDQACRRVRTGKGPRRVTGFKVLRIDPTAFSEADGRRPWLAIHQCLGDRTFMIFLKIRLCVDQITHFHQKTARRSVTVSAP